MPIRAVTYGRESGDEQVQFGAGIPAQVDGCRALAAKEGWEFVGPFLEDEGVSGATPIERRPALMEALGELRRGDILLVWKRDRIARDRKIIFLVEMTLKSKKCRLISTHDEGTVSEDPDDIQAIIQRTVSDLFAEIERLTTKVRTKAALAAKRRRNERTGTVPYGHDLVDDGKRSKPRRDGKGNLPIGLAANPTELAVLAELLKLRRAGWTYDRLAWALGYQKILTKRGKPWHRSSVHHVLKRIESDPCHPVHALAASADAPLPTSSAS